MTLAINFFEWFIMEKSTPYSMRFFTVDVKLFVHSCHNINILFIFDQKVWTRYLSNLAQISCLSTSKFSNRSIVFVFEICHVGRFISTTLSFYWWGRWWWEMMNDASDFIGIIACTPLLRTKWSTVHDTTSTRGSWISCSLPLLTLVARLKHWFLLFHMSCRINKGLRMLFRSFIHYWTFADNGRVDIKFTRF